MAFKWVSSNQRDAYLPLLLLGDEDLAMVQQYLHQGDLLVAFASKAPVGVALFVPVAADTIELKNLAVRPDHQRRGIGTQLVQQGLAHYAQQYRQMLVGTGDAERDNLRFYQGLGFRQSGVRKDFFAQYDHEMIVDGVALRDMVLLTRALAVR